MWIWNAPVPPKPCSQQKYGVRSFTKPFLKIKISSQTQENILALLYFLISFSSFLLLSSVMKNFQSKLRPPCPWVPQLSLVTELCLNFVINSVDEAEIGRWFSCFFCFPKAGGEQQPEDQQQLCLWVQAGSWRCWVKQQRAFSLAMVQSGLAAPGDALCSSCVQITAPQALSLLLPAEAFTDERREHLHWFYTVLQ